jgi:hypothetical protein
MKIEMNIRHLDKKHPFDFVIDIVLCLTTFILFPSIITVKGFGAFINMLSGNET